MAISRIQQSQISGSLSYDDTLSAGSGLAGKSKLSDDLNALRSLVKDIKGSSKWYDAASQDLSEIYAAMRASGSDASMQGKLYVAGDAGLSGSLAVAGAASLASSLNVAQSITGSSSLTIAGPGIFSDTLTVSGQGSFSSGLTVGQGFTASYADIGGGYGSSGVSVSAAGDVKANGALTVDGPAYLSGSVAAASLAVVGNETIGGTLGVSGAATLSSTLGVTGAATFSSAVGVGGNLTVTGTSAHVGASTFSAISNQFNALAVTGSAGLNVVSNASVGGTLSSTGNFAVNTNKFTVAAASGNTAIAGTLGVAGAASLSSTLGVTGAATFASTIAATGQINANGGISAANVVSAGTGSFASGVSVASGGVTVAAGGITVQNGSTSVQGLSAAGSVSFSDTLGVSGFATLGSGMSVAGSATFNGAAVTNAALTANGSFDAKGSSSMNNLSITGSAGLSVSAASSFNGIVDANAGLSASLIKIDGDTAQRLYIVDSDGSIKDESKLVFDGSDLSITGGLRVSGNAQVDGDLLVKGAFTYIETQNMKVKDAFIYLATGSAGASDSGIVLSKGAGAAWDLVVGQDGGAGELIFAKQAHNSAGTSPAALDGSALVPAWMSEVKLGGAEGALSGSLKWDASGIKLESVSAAVALSAAGNLSFSANGNAAISFASASQVPDASFQASTIVGMLNELRQDLDSANSGGNLTKVAYAGSAVNSGTGVLSFVGQSLSSADHKLVDVFLNGVLMAPGYDLTAIGTSSVTFASSIASSLIADDVIVIVARG